MTNLEQAPDESFSTSSHQPDGTLGNDESNAEGGVAIIGLACKLPGACQTPEDFWALLVSGRSGYGMIPKERFDANGFHQTEESGLNGIRSTSGHFIEEDVRLFENSFFGLNNAEATAMDPQQRKILEVVFECFESAGIRLENISGQDIGTFVGSFTNDFYAMQFENAENATHYTSTAAALSVMANRISHTFNLTGPSMTVDTACASALYGLHLACNALDSRQCSGAIVASANLIQNVWQHLQNEQAGILSPESICHTFDVSANGYGRAEAVGALYLKRLPDAIRDGDPIRAVIRGTAVNSNGRTKGISAPSTTQQCAVIEKAYQNAVVSYDRTQYVEAHGTGTQAGDTAELRALASTIEPAHGKLLVGSVKTNLGHSEGASAITSIIKVILAMEKGLIPPTIGVRKLRPEIMELRSRLQVITEPTAWPGPTDKRRAGVNAFGFGGANAHVILDGNYGVVQQTKTGLSKEPQETVILPLSAYSRESLDQRISALAGYLEKQDVEIDDLLHTLGSRRSNMAERAFVVADRRNLNESISLDTATFLSSTSKVSSSGDGLTFVFTGQGAQWPGMGAGLQSHFAVVENSIRNMDLVLQALPRGPEWKLADIFAGGDSVPSVYEAAISQPACVALQIALVDLMSSWGVKPSTVIGHSSGEIAAAYALGAIDAGQAISIAYYRGLVVSQSKGLGAMAAVGLGAEQVESELQSIGVSARVGIAAINSPQSTTISGDADAVDEVISQLTSAKIFARKLKTDGRAYHSSHMKELGQTYEDLLVPVLQPSKAINGDKGTSVSSSIAARMYSSVHGKKVDGVSLNQPSYWRTNLESPVLFQAAVSLALQDGHPMIEIGPHPALRMPVEQTYSESNTDSQSAENQKSQSSGQLHYLSSLERGKANLGSMLRLAGDLFLRGIDVDFAKVNGLPLNCQVVTTLPKYAWNYGEKLLWTEARSTAEFRNRKYARHYLLGARIPGTSGQTFSWSNNLNLKHAPYIRDHRVGDLVIYPAVAYIRMAMEAMCQAENDHSFSKPVLLRHVKVLKALMFEHEDQVTEVVTELRRTKVTMVSASTRFWSFEVSSFSANGVSTTHARGLIGFTHENMPEPAPASGLWPDSLTAHDERHPSESWYSQLNTAGLTFGPAFRVLRNVKTSRSQSSVINGQPSQPSQLVADTVLYEDNNLPDTSYTNEIVHPVMIDSMLQAAVFAGAGEHPRGLVARVPVSLEEILIRPGHDNRTNTRAIVTATSSFVGFGTTVNSTDLYYEDSKAMGPSMSIKNVKFVEYNEGSLTTGNKNRSPILRVQWLPDLEILQSYHQEQIGDWLASMAQKELSACSAAETISWFLRLASHKVPNSRYLFLVSDVSKLEHSFLDVLNRYKSLQQFQSMVVASLISGNLKGIQIDGIPDDGHLGSLLSRPVEDIEVPEAGFDIIIAPETGYVEKVQDDLELFSSFIKPNTILAHCSSEQSVESTKIDLSLSVKLSPLFVTGTHDGIELRILRCDSDVVPKSPPQSEAYGNRPAYFIHHDTLTSFEEEYHSAIETQMGTNVTKLDLSALDDLTLADGCFVFATFELKRFFLSDIDAITLARIQKITTKAHYLIWLTNGDYFTHAVPEMTLVTGLSRSIMLEEPSLKFLICDLELGFDATEALSVKTRANLGLLLHQLVTRPHAEYEFVQKDGLMYSSRILPDEVENETFRQKQLDETRETTICEADRFRLALDQPGNVDSLFWSQLPPHEDPPQGFVQVQAKSFSMNAKDVHVILGNVESKNCNVSLEFAGVITKVHPGSGFSVEERVLVMMPNQLESIVMVPEWCCCRLRDEESYSTVSTLPLVFSTAHYALVDNARLQPGETVLIHSAAGGLGQAAIQIAKAIGATIYATIGDEEKRAFLIEKYGIADENIFYSRNDQFVQQVRNATTQRGVNVVLNSLTGDLLDASWQCLANFGRFIEVGRRDIAEAGFLDMSVFKRNVMFHAFDLSDLFNSTDPKHNKIWSGLLQKTIDLYRQGKIRPVEPVLTFCISELKTAIRTFQSRNRMGKVTLSLETGQATVALKPLQHLTVLSPTKSYILSGGLGGLGRSLTRWLMRRGARNFVFISRSGLDKQPSRDFVAELERDGAFVTTIRGSVADRDDVQRAIDACTTPIGGVIQAAMSLEEVLFNEMTSSGWNYTVTPKVRGSWNLHEALTPHEKTLDFFLLASSMTGTLKMATLTNYCAGNAFMDAFAGYRRSQGLPAVSIGLGMLSEVGYIHERPELERLMLRRGWQPINEAECLQHFDMALTRENSSQRREWGRSLQARGSGDGLLLTGLELSGLMAQREQGYEGSSQILLDDCRLSLLVWNFERQTAALGIVAGGGREDIMPDPATASQKDLTAAVLQLVTQKMENLLLLPPGSLDPTKTLADFGMDSMLAAEFRTHFFRQVGVDVPFLRVLDAGATAMNLAMAIVDDLKAKS